MKREIKFKYIIKRANGFMFSQVFTLTDIEDCSFLIWKGTNNVDDTEIIAKCQYTGLKDRNGVEIYEGDVVECRMVGIETHLEILNAQISYFTAAGGFGFEVIGSESDYRLFAFNDRNILSIEVIGNVFANPELVKS